MYGEGIYLIFAWKGLRKALVWEVMFLNYFGLIVTVILLVFSCLKRNLVLGVLAFVC
jgi:hypothetical protein